MSEKKILSQDQLNKVSGGNDDNTYVDVKTIVYFKILGIENSDEVVFKMLAIDNKVAKADIEAAAETWCNERSYEYVSVSICYDNGYFVVY